MKTKTLSLFLPGLENPPLEYTFACQDEELIKRRTERFTSRFKDSYVSADGFTMTINEPLKQFTPAEWLDVLVNLTDLKQIEFCNNEMILRETNETSRKDFAAGFDGIEDLETLIQNNGFVLLASLLNDDMPYVYVYLGEGELYRVHTHTDSDDVVYLALRELESLSAPKLPRHIYANKQILKALEYATERNYYPKGLNHAYLTIHELFY